MITSPIRGKIFFPSPGWEGTNCPAKLHIRSHQKTYFTRINFRKELIAENRFNSKDPRARNTMLALASMFGTRNVTNALDILDSYNSNNMKLQRWNKHVLDKTSHLETDTVVTEFITDTSQKKLIQVCNVIHLIH